MLLDRLFPRRPATDATPAESLHTRKIGGVGPWSETPGVIWSRQTSAAGVHVDEYEALTISAVFAACFRLANVAAMLPVGVYERTDDGRRQEKPLHSVSRILNVEANPAQTAFTARHFMQFWKPLFGAACAEIGWDGAGRPRYIWPLEPWRVEPKYDDRSGREGGLYFEVDGNRRVAPADIVYVPHVTEDGVTGRGFLHYALESLGQAIAADRSAGRFFENDMRPGGILLHEGNPSKEARGELREEWKRNQGGKNRGSVGVLWGGWKWIKEAGMIEPDKAQLLESRQWSVLEVARWLNVPPHWLAELGRATWNNIESQSIEALIYCVQPLLTSTEQEYDRKLLAPPRVYSKHAVNALLRADMKTRAEFYRLMREIGVYDANHILALEDENGIGPEGDRRFVPVNWQPADDLMTGGEAQRKAAEASKPDPQPAAKPVADPEGSGEKPATSEGDDEGSESNAARPAANPPATAGQPGPTPEMLEALRSVAEQALGGLARKELNEARRAAKKPGDVTKWMDGFYPDFSGTLASGLDATNQLRRAMGCLESNLWPASVAADWVARSRNDLLDAMECRSEEWPKRSAALFLSWEGRAAEAAARIVEGVTS